MQQDAVADEQAQLAAHAVQDPDVAIGRDPDFPAGTLSTGDGLQAGTRNSAQRTQNVTVADLPTVADR